LLFSFSLSQFALADSPKARRGRPANHDDSDIAKSIAESGGGPLQFAEGSFLGMAEAMPEDKYSFCSDRWQLRWRS
jgi:hypothetical protein